jgi:hypothetical protein
MPEVIKKQQTGLFLVRDYLLFTQEFPGIEAE